MVPLVRCIFASLALSRLILLEPSGIHKSKRPCQIISDSPGYPPDHSRKGKFVDDVVLQDDGVVASVSSGDEIGPTSVHEGTDARAETEYTADDYELPAGASNSI